MHCPQFEHCYKIVVFFEDGRLIDLHGECRRDVYGTLVLAIQHIKKSGRGQLKRPKLLELPARDGRDRVYKYFVPALEIAISNSNEVTKFFKVKTSLEIVIYQKCMVFEIVI